MKRYLAMPDWREKEDYSFTNELSGEGWAWEFLRRSPLYREAYEDLQNVMRELDEVKDAYIFFPARRDEESISAWSIRCILDGVKPDKSSLSVWMAGVWGIKGPMVNPFITDTFTPKFLNSSRFPEIVNLDSFLDYFNDEGYEANSQYVLIGVDLNQSTKVQIETLRKILKEKKELFQNEAESHTKLNKGRARNWQEHLRILDALSAGASNKEIWTYLFPDPTGKNNPDATEKKNLADKIYDRKKAAISYRDYRYIYIP